MSRCTLSRPARPIAIVALLAICMSCDRQTVPTEFNPQSPAAKVAALAIVDGANGGVAGFYFLPPTVPTTPAFSGVFDATLARRLRIEVCRLNGVGACRMPPIAVLTSDAADPRNAIRVDAAHEFYSVDWYTGGRLPQSEKTYRVSVMLDGVVLGYIDILDPKAESWVPIRFRIEQGIGGGNPAPVVAIQSPADGTAVTEGSGLNLRAVATDTPDGDVSASITWSSSLQGALGNGPSLDNVVLLAGTHVITAKATDSQGATGTAAITVTVSANAPPAVTITSPASNAQLIFGAPVTFAATAQDPEDGSVAASLTWTSDLEGALGNGASITVNNLRAGTHVVTATATDSRGLTASATITVTVTASNSPPVVTITSPADGSSFAEGTTVNFTADATDPESGNLNGSIQWLIDGVAVASGPAYSSSSLSAGGHAVEARVADPNGGTASDTINITITANAAPIVSITAPADGSVHPAGTPLSLSASASDVEDGNLSSSIQWSSSRQGILGSGGNISVNLAGGTHTITASVTDAGGLAATASITVVVSIVTVPATLNVPYAGTASLPITLTEPAPLGGLTLDITTSNPGAVGVQTGTVTIPAGQQSANATLTGVAPGLSTVAASSPAYGSASSQVSTTADLNIVETSVSFPFNATHQITIQLESNGNPVAAPAGGITIDLTAGDAQCAANQQVLISSGLVSVSANIAYGGSATLPCATVVTASAAGMPIGADNLNVTVNAAAPINIGNLNTVRVGSGLQFGPFTVTLGAPAPAGGVSLTIQSSDANVLRIAPGAATAGSGSLVLNVPAGQTAASYYLQGIEWQTGQPTLTFSAPGYQNAASTVQVVPAAVEIVGLNTTSTSISPNDPFQLRIGAVSATNNGLYAEQEVRAGGAPIVFDVTNSDAAVGQLVTSATTGQAVTVSVPVGAARSAATLATGGIEFDPLGGGTTTVTAGHPNVISLFGASQTVTVGAGSISWNVGSLRIGSGLQYGPFTFTLSAPAPVGGLAVTLQSADANLLLVSPNASTAGSASRVITVAAGQTGGTFWLQGMENATGSADIIFSAPGFANTTATVPVVPVAVDIQNLNTSTTTLSPNDPFQVRIGAVTAAGNGLYAEQAVRIGGTPITFDVTNRDGAVGQLVTSAGAGQSLTVSVPVGAARSATTVAAGGIEFDALGSGTTTVAASNPNVISLAAATQTVNVTGPAITWNVGGLRLGSGLQFGPFTFTLGAPAPAGGLAVTLQSSDGNLLLVSPNASTAGSASRVINVAAGQTGGTFWLQGMENTTGSAVITFSAPGFTGTTATVPIVPVAFDILAPTLNPNTTTLSPNDPFQVRVGAVNATSNGLYAEQAVRIGGTAMTFDVTSSNASVGQLVTTAVTGQTVAVSVPVGAARSPLTVASGGIEFDPLGIGTTTVSVSSPNAVALAAATQTVNVTAPSISANLNGVRVGSGLQYGSINFTLGAPAPTGGLSVTITSSAPGVLLVSPNQTTSGTGTLIVNVAGGQNAGTFWVQGMEDQAGTATLTFSAAGFTNGSATIDVVPVAVDIINLATSTTSAAANDPFQVRVGAVNATNNGFYAEQTVRAGGTGLSINVSNSAAAIAQLLFSGGAAQTGSVVIGAGASRSAATLTAGGVEFDPITTGTSTVTASGAGIVTLPSGSVAIVVN